MLGCLSTSGRPGLRFLQPLCLGPILPRFRLVAPGLVYLGAGEIGLGILGIEADRLVEVRERRSVLSLAKPSDAAVPVRLGQFRIKAERFLTVGDDLVQLAEVQTHRRAVAID